MRSPHGFYDNFETRIVRYSYTFRVIVRHPYDFISQGYQNRTDIVRSVRTYHGVREFIVKPPCDFCAFLMGYGYNSPFGFNKTACLFILEVGST